MFSISKKYSVTYLIGSLILGFMSGVYRVKYHMLFRTNRANFDKVGVIAAFTLSGPFLLLYNIYAIWHYRSNMDRPISWPQYQ